MALCACSYIRQVPPAPIDPVANAGNLQTRALSAAAVTGALDRYGLPQPAGDHWTMDQLTVAAWTLNPDVAVARAELDAARAATAVAQLPPNPSLDLNLERVISNVSSTPWVLGASLGLLLQPGGKLDIRRDRALIQERVQQAQLGASLWAICLGVRRSVLDRALAGELLALDRQETALRQDYLDWIETRLALGAATSQDRLQASEALQASQSRERFDSTAVTTASVQLAALIGISPGQLSRIDMALPAAAALPAGIMSDIGRARDLALANRLDIRRALAEYALAEQDLRATLAGQYPDLGLGPGYLFDQGDHKLTLNTSIPLALHGSNRARIAQAVANRAVAARRFDQVQARALSAIDGRYALFTSQRDALDAAVAVQAVAQSSVQTVRQRLDAGAANRGDLLSAQLLLVQRQRDTLAARQLLATAVSDLEDAIQKPIYPASSLVVDGAANDLDPSS